MEQLYVEVLYTIRHKLGAHSAKYPHHFKEDLVHYAQTAFGVGQEYHRRCNAIASEEKVNNAMYTVLLFLSSFVRTRCVALAVSALHIDSVWKMRTALIFAPATGPWWWASICAAKNNLSNNICSFYNAFFFSINREGKMALLQIHSGQQDVVVG